MAGWLVRVKEEEGTQPFAPQPAQTEPLRLPSDEHRRGERWQGSGCAEMRGAAGEGPQWEGRTQWRQMCRCAAPKAAPW